MASQQLQLEAQAPSASFRKLEKKWNGSSAILGVRGRAARVPGSPKWYSGPRSGYRVRLAESGFEFTLGVESQFRFQVLRMVWVRVRVLELWKMLSECSPIPLGNSLGNQIWVAFSRGSVGHWDVGTASHWGSP